jgi:hypothetical protein
VVDPLNPFRITRVDFSFPGFVPVMGAILPHEVVFDDPVVIGSSADIATSPAMTDHALDGNR